jgi:mannan endo-1,4-beta-mannosidase
MKRILLLFILTLSSFHCFSQNQFIVQKDGRFFLKDQEYTFIGTNYWYGVYLPLQQDTARGINRLRYELDFLKARGVTNLRVLAGAEGSGKILGNYRVGPPLQTAKGVFDTSVLYGLDVLLDEMAKRNMKAVIYFSNNWEWSGGFLQYLNWNGIISDSVLQNKMEWETMRDVISQFYTCEPCKSDYLKQVDVVMSRINSVNKRKYIDDPTIMSWQIANEPRPMRPAVNEAFAKWITDVAAYIKSRDKNHLVSTGSEGNIATETDLFKSIHADKNIDYLTIHIWPRNWGWGDSGKVLTKRYITNHHQYARSQGKPLVIEEFGWVRDDLQFTPTSSTNERNEYFDLVLSALTHDKLRNLVGITFWSFNGKARPLKDQLFWKPGDDYMGDPPMEQQSLYGVFDSDSSTWKVIETHVKLLQQRTNRR